MPEKQDPETGESRLHSEGSTIQQPRVVAMEGNVLNGLDSVNPVNGNAPHHGRICSSDITETLVGVVPSNCANSKSSSDRSRPMSTIPRSKRRGLLGSFTIIPEVERPYEYGNGMKWALTSVVALAAATVPMGSSIFYPALPEMSLQLNASPTVTNMSVALYILSLSIFPLWWSSFSETWGRRTVYLTSFALFVLWTVLAALSTSISMLIVMRILSGGAGASVQAVGAGTIADMWESKERGRAMGIFYLGPLMGPLLAPIIGGLLTQSFGWRSTVWFLAVYGGVLLVVLTLFLPETLRATKPTSTPARNQSLNVDEKSTARPKLSQLSTSQYIQNQVKNTQVILKRCIVEPLYILIYLRFPPIALTVYYASITSGVLYVLNISIQQTFSRPPYSYSINNVGLLYIPSSLGYVIASILGGKWSDVIMHREARRANRYDADGKLVLNPEDRVRENAYLAAAVYPAALLWYGWSVQYHAHWSIVATANFFFGLGSMIVFSMSTTTLTEFMPQKSSSGVAVNNFVRNIMSCVGGVVASPLIDAIGNGWLFTGLSIITWLSGFTVWCMRRHGARWRETMNRTVNG